MDYTIPQVSKEERRNLYEEVEAILGGKLDKTTPQPLEPVSTEALMPLPDQVSYTDDQLMRLKASGFAKPTNIPWYRWNNTSSLGHRERTIAYMVASGIREEQIRLKTKYPVEKYKELVQTDEFNKEVERLQWNLFGKTQEDYFRRLLPLAANTIEEIILNPDTKEQTKLDASKTILDRAMGKPMQQVEVKGSLIKDVYQELGRRTVSEIIDAEHEEIKTEEKLDTEKKDTIDQYMEEMEKKNA